MWTIGFWRDTAERAIRTAAQAAVGVLTATSVQAIDWPAAGITVGVATAVSVLMSIGATGVGDHDSPSLVDYRGRHRSGE